MFGHMWWAELFYVFLLGLLLYPFSNLDFELASKPTHMGFRTPSNVDQTTIIRILIFPLLKKISYMFNYQFIAL